MKVSQIVFKLQIRHEYVTQITIYHIQMAITPKVGKPQLLFLCSACCLMVVNISVKFLEVSIHNICFYEETEENILELSSNTPL